MHLTAKEIELIRDSYRRIIPEVDRIAEEFYADLFRRDPKLRGLFRDDMAGQGMRFMAAISVIVDNLDDAEQLDRQVDLLAQAHGQFRLREQAYRTMQEALIDTFRYGLGQRFTNEMQLAWRSAFSQICDAMMEAQAADHV